MNDIIQLLNSVEIVTKVQNFFGIYLERVEEIKEELYHSNSQNELQSNDLNQNDSSLIKRPIINDHKSEDEKHNSKNNIYDKINDKEKKSNKNQLKSNQYSVLLLNRKRCIYRVENKLLYYFFIFITNFGNEAFYISFLPIMTWNYDDKVIYLTAMAWVITMYLGQVTKDLIKIPRPITPPVVKVEDKYLTEYGNYNHF